MTSKDLKSAWAAVGDELSSLGLKLKLHAEQEFSEDAGEVASALKRLGERLDDAVDAIGNVSKDEAVREDLREVRVRLVDAMAATLDRAKSELQARGGSGPK